MFDDATTQRNEYYTRCSAIPESTGYSCNDILQILTKSIDRPVIAIMAKMKTTQPAHLSATARLAAMSAGSTLCACTNNSYVYIPTIVAVQYEHRKKVEQTLNSFVVVFLH